MDFPERSAGQLYGLQNHSVVPMNWVAPDGERYIMVSLHVTPIADSGGAISALPAVCCTLAKARALQAALADAIDALTRPH